MRGRVLELAAIVLLCLAGSGCMLVEGRGTRLHAVIYEPVEGTEPSQSGARWAGLWTTTVNAAVQVVHPELAALGIVAGLVTSDAIETAGNGQIRAVRMFVPPGQNATVVCTAAGELNATVTDPDEPKAVRGEPGQAGPAGARGPQGDDKDHASGDARPDGRDANRPAPSRTSGA